MQPSSNLPPQDLRHIKDLAAAIVTELERRGFVTTQPQLALTYESTGKAVEASGRTIRNLADKGLLQRVVVGESPRILVSSIHAYLDAQAQKGKQ